MNFEWDGKLAERQDRVIHCIEQHVPIDAQDIKALRENWLVWLMAIFCPCNLVVRHYILLDLINDSRAHEKKIIRLCEQLTFKDTGLWAEGYSYWRYTKWAIDLYTGTWLRVFSIRQELAFEDTAYRRADGKLYPVPYGDVWDNALETQPSGCGYKNVPPVKWWLIDTRKPVVEIKAQAVMFNLHTSTVDDAFHIVDGRPLDVLTDEPFVYYRGYREKYPTRWAEFKAIIQRAIELLNLT